MKLSRRKLRSYTLAERTCRELRYQLTHAGRWDANALFDHLFRWMRVTGKIKYERPTPARRSIR